MVRIVPSSEGQRRRVQAYAALRSAGQPFHEWINATGHTTIVELAEPEEVEGYENPCLTDGKQSWYPFDLGVLLLH